MGKIWIFYTCKILSKMWANWIATISSSSSISSCCCTPHQNFIVAIFYYYNIRELYSLLLLFCVYVRCMHYSVYDIPKCILYKDKIVNRVWWWWWWWGLINEKLEKLNTFSLLLAFVQFIDIYLFFLITSMNGINNNNLV